MTFAEAVAAARSQYSQGIPVDPRYVRVIVESCAAAGTSTSRNAITQSLYDGARLHHEQAVRDVQQCRASLHVNNLDHALQAYGAGCENYGKAMALVMRLPAPDRDEVLGRYYEHMDLCGVMGGLDRCREDIAHLGTPR